MEQFLHIPENYSQLFLVVIFSLVIGLSQRKLQMKSDENEPFFGSDRTFTLIGLLSYILYIIDPVTKIFWGCGGAALLIILGFNYYFKLYHLRRYGITTIVIALITYCIPALIMTQPFEFSLLVLVIVLLLTEMKETFISFANRMNNDEILTLVKFIIIAGIILPILSNERIIAEVDLTPRKIWMSTVIISGMSYVSYLLQKFVFHSSGLLVAGILGGLYSSTATTVVLSRKSKKAPESLRYQYSGAIVMATGMMFVRVMILLFIFNMGLFLQTWYYFVSLFMIITGVGLAIYYYKPPTAEQLQNFKTENDTNPLEFRVALIFAVLFVVFTLATFYTIQEFGTYGLKVLSFVVGVTDVTPFIISLFQGGYEITASTVISAVFLSLLSNNIVKLGYGLAIGPKRTRKPLIVGFAIACVATLIVLLIV
ncbi:MAG: DUF4010 domain-containing protein [Dysgonamonadaceae bacterium]|jgi:uncharacterized membrane protein (DUF4010 family)|nr:DUF4010 domain-containing protein [Dysgonamonadaceae bacterium]